MTQNTEQGVTSTSKSNSRKRKYVTSGPSVVGSHSQTQPTDVPTSPFNQEFSYGDLFRRTLRQDLIELREQVDQLGADRGVESLDARMRYHECFLQNLNCNGNELLDEVKVPGAIERCKADIARVRSELEIARWDIRIEQINAEMKQYAASRWIISAGDPIISAYMIQLKDAMEKRAKRHDFRRSIGAAPETVTSLAEDFARSISGQYLTFPHKFLGKIGFLELGCSHDTILFRRHDCDRQIRFMLNEVIKNGFFGAIRGSPGCGKSSTAFYVACHLRKDWDTIWVDCRMSQIACLFIIKQNEFTMSSMRYGEVDLEEMSSILGPKTLLIMDGLHADDSADRELLDKAARWNQRDGVNRRSLRILSSGALHPWQVEYKLLNVGSWRLAEYQEAVQDDKFWSSVRHTFYNDDLIAFNDREKLVDWKFLYAGTRAEFMFSASVQEIKCEVQSIKGALIDKKSWHSLMPTYERHRLISVCSESSQMTGFVSQYVARQIGKTFSSAMVRDHINNCTFIPDPVTKEWAFQAWFFSSIRDSSKMVVTMRNKPKSKLTWRTRDPTYPWRVNEFCPSGFQTIYPDSWMIPDVRQDGGFDAAMLVSETSTIRFLQLTTESSSGLKMAYFADLVTRLRQRHYTVEDAEIFVVIPQGRSAQNFTNGPIEDSTLFTKLFDSWKQCDVEQQVRIAMVPFLNV